MRNDDTASLDIGVTAQILTGAPLVSPNRLLLQDMIDYAGLLPPASLTMAEAAAEYRKARSGRHAWVLGKFLCPTSRLDDLAHVLTATMLHTQEPWEVGAIFDQNPASSAATAQAFQAEMNPAAAVASAEVGLPAEVADGRPAAAAADVAHPLLLAASSISPTVVTFLEVPITQAEEAGISNAVEAIALLAGSTHRSTGAKLRCGGLEAGRIPSPGQVARFVASCARSGIKFKATGGLHHPVRHLDAALGARRHGFINLLAAAALAEVGEVEDVLAEVLRDEDPASFKITASGLAWRHLHAGSSVIKRVRADRFSSYGSCSFDEPIEDLITLGILPAAL